eukprot:2107549-Pleurochrysis_carterae.AAC.1
MAILGVHWAPMSGGADDAATQLVARTDDGAADAETYDDGQLLMAAGEDETQAWRRAGVLCTVGL